MSGMVSSGGSNSQDFDINLAPIIDCFTVLIAFMLASASFLAIGIMDAGVAAAGAAPASATPPKIQLTVEIKQENDRFSFLVKTSGQSTSSQTVAGTAENKLDYAQLSEVLGKLKSQHPDLNAVTLMADNQVEYLHIVQSMEAVRKQIPAVLLGGF